MGAGSREEIISSIKKTIEAEIASGVREIHIVKEKGKSKKAKSPEAEDRRRGEKGDLETLQKEVSSCGRCPLAETRTNVVFGEGHPRARLMFIGEAPGGDEDKQGRPFVGRAGQLLTKIIESIGLERKDVFIANILKCRPPNNRNPLPSEIAACSPYLIKQIELIRPEVICALGKFAAQTLLNSETPISRLRGTFYDFRGIKLMPTYHPAYLLRNPGGKKEVWEDMKKVAKELGLEIPKHKGKK